MAEVQRGFPGGPQRDQRAAVVPDSPREPPADSHGPKLSADERKNPRKKNIPEVLGRNKNNGWSEGGREKRLKAAGIQP